MKKIVYFDNAATTPVREEVLNEMLPYFTEDYGNASSVYSLSKKSKRAILKARERVANLIGAEPSEIIFTSGGTESDNFAIKGVADALKEKGKHIITTSIEHHAILNSCKNLEEKGFEITYMPVDEYGMIDVSELENAIRSDTILISVMFANNEIGTIEPIKEIGEIARKKGIYFHTDAVQAAGHAKIDVNEMCIDLLSVSGHKLGAQKGIGALYVRKGVRLKRAMDGGSQEGGMRAGTENVPAIVGLGKAAELSETELDSEEKRLSIMRDKLIKSILESIPFSRLNGHPEKRLPGNCNISFEYIDGSSLVAALDTFDICASSASACSSASHEPSHVLTAIKSEGGSLRFSLGHGNTDEEIDYVISVLPRIVQGLRNMSPVYEDYLKNKEL
ncbi:MAG: cysteine desulfurase NifS [Lachnospiraceae bacterium]|nr:cysteine desulfurase NifS [Lachnospiraceae bacterium]